MSKTNQVLLSILLLVILGGVGIIYFQVQDPILKTPLIPTLPTADLSTNTPSPDTVQQSATEMSGAGQAVPTMEYVYIYKHDPAGLLNFLIEQSKDWVNIYTNVHSIETPGVATASETIYNKACDSPWPLNNLCKSATIEYMAVYKGTLHGGVEANFVLSPVVTLKGDWSEIERITTGNRTEIIMGSTAIITYSGKMCITSVEENTPSLLADGQVAPDDGNSYILKTRDERLLPDIGSWVYDLDVNEEALRFRAYVGAKAIALAPERVQAFYQIYKSDFNTGGAFYEAVKAFYTPELAKLYSVRGFEIVMNPIEGNPSLRCDGTPVNK